MAQLSNALPQVPSRRPRGLAYLLLARVSNLPTVWSNVLAGSAAAAAAVVGSAETAPPPWLQVGLTALAASLFYTGGMFLNDAFDASYDRLTRPERPISRGDVSRGEAFAIGGVCLLAGELLLPPGLSRWLGAALAAAIVTYDFSHKQNPVAPIVMGFCRALVYAVAGGVGGTFAAGVLMGGGVMWVYVSGLTVVARLAGPKARWLVPLLIAGISLVDAAFIAVIAPTLWPLAIAAALAFPLTLFLQRWVPGD